MEAIKKRIKKYYPYLFFVLAAFLILSVQIFHHITIMGFDSYFHMSRAYETANQISTGHFSYFMSLFSWLGSGRIVNALYGPLGGYFMGIILLITHSWYHWELVMDFIVLIGSGSTMYALGKYWKDNTLINIIISIIYMVSYPPMVFITNNEFTGVGAIFIPLVVLVGSRILVERHIPIINLVIVITLIAEIHSMTLLISVLFLVPFVINGFIITSQKTRYIIDLLEAMIWVLLLTVNVWGSILEVMLSNSHHIIPTFPAMKNMGGNWYDAIQYTHGSLSVIGGALALICIVCIVAWIFTFSTKNPVVNTLMSTGTFFLWVSSQWFPWKTLQSIMPILDIIQFPKRFLVLGLVPMLVAFGALATPLFNLHHISCKVLVLVFLCILGLESWNFNNVSYKLRVQEFHSPNVIVWNTTREVHHRKPNTLRKSLFSNNPSKLMNIISKPVPDYLPTSIYYTAKKYNKMNFWRRDYAQLIKPFSNSKRYQQSCSNHAQKNIKITVNYSGLHRIPFTFYKHSSVKVNGKIVHPKLSKVGAMFVYLHTGMNNIQIKYHPNHWFEIGLIISLFTWAMFILSVKWKHENEQIEYYKQHQS